MKQKVIRLLFCQVVLQLLATFSLLFLEANFPDWWGFAKLQRMGFEQIFDFGGGGRTSAAQHIRFIDSSRLLTRSRDETASKDYAPENGFTNRIVLGDAVLKLIQEEARVIAIDIDFSPDFQDDVRPPSGYQAFLILCNLLDSRQTKAPPHKAPRHELIDSLRLIGNDPGVSDRQSQIEATVTHQMVLGLSKIFPRLTNPETLAGLQAVETKIVLGVGRTSFEPEPHDWLGFGSGVQQMAASITLFREDKVDPPIYSLAPLRINAQGGMVNADPLESFSFKTAKAFSDAKLLIECEPGWLGERLADDERLVEIVQGKVEADAYYLDFSQLEAFKNRGAPVDLETFINGPPARADFAGKIVIIGDVDVERTPDKIVAPGEERMVSGAVFHAVGVATLLGSPVYRLRDGFQFAMGLVISFGVPIGAQLILKRARPEMIIHPVREEIAEFFLIALATIVTAFLLAYLFGVLWIAWLGCIAGSVVESLLVLWVICAAPEKIGEPPEEAAEAVLQK